MYGKERKELCGKDTENAEVAGRGHAPVRQEGAGLTLVSHSNVPRNGSKLLENTTVFPA